MVVVITEEDCTVFVARYDVEVCLVDCLVSSAELDGVDVVSTLG